MKNQSLSFSLLLLTYCHWTRCKNQNESWIMRTRYSFRICPWSSSFAIIAYQSSLAFASIGDQNFLQIFVHICVSFCRTSMWQDLFKCFVTTNTVIIALSSSFNLLPQASLSRGPARTFNKGIFFTVAFVLLDSILDDSCLVLSQCLLSCPSFLQFARYD